PAPVRLAHLPELLAAHAAAPASGAGSSFSWTELHFSEGAVQSNCPAHARQIRRAAKTLGGRDPAGELQRTAGSEIGSPLRGPSFGDQSVELRPGRTRISRRS